MSLAVAAALMMSICCAPATMRESACGDSGRFESSGSGVRAMLLLTDDANALVRSWQRTPIDAVFAAKQVTDVDRSTSMAGFVAFSNCVRATDGRCSVTADYSLIGPNKTTVAVRRAVAISTESVPPGFVELGSAAFTIHFDEHDRNGQYQVRAVVHDDLAHKTLVLCRCVQLR